MRVYEGVVIPGAKGAAKAADRDNRLEIIEQATGLRCVPGTLNVNIGMTVDLSGCQPALEHLFPNTLLGLGPVGIYRAELIPHGREDATPCALFRHVGTALRTVLEVMAESHLRTTLGLRDGDQVAVTILSGAKR